MPTYNYSEISDFEFESLCRDLLQAELGLALELFAPGPDRGIDIRYLGVVKGVEQAIVAQCKRWAEDSFRRLLRPPRNRGTSPSRETSSCAVHCDDVRSAIAGSEGQNRHRHPALGSISLGRIWQRRSFRATGTSPGG